MTELMDIQTKAKAGDAKAQTILSKLYRFGDQGVEEDEKKPSFGLCEP